MSGRVSIPPVREGTPAGPVPREVRELMTPGVVTIPEDSTVRQVRRAMHAHRVHAVLVVGRALGRPIGWVTARGLLDWAGRDELMASARDAVTERPVWIEPGAPAMQAVRALSQPGVTHLLVQRAAEYMPEGVLSEVDVLNLGED